MRFPELPVETVVFLFSKTSNVPLATAFIVEYPVSVDMMMPLVVTAKHVVGKEQKIIARFNRRSNGPPIEVVYDLDDLHRKGDIWEHPDKGVDLTVFRMSHQEEVKYGSVPQMMIASREIFREEEIKATNRVIFPCLLVNFMGTSRNYPFVRQGSIALIPDEPVPLHYDVGSTRIETSQEVIFLDATAIPGASGSPVFLAPGLRPKGKGMDLGGGPFLLGVIHGFYPALPREAEEMQVTKTGLGFRENTGIAIAFPSWRLLEILELKELRERISEVIGS